jgi:hypothetical protein
MPFAVILLWINDKQDDENTLGPVVSCARVRREGVASAGRRSEA